VGITEPRESEKNPGDREGKDKNKTRGDEERKQERETKREYCKQETVSRTRRVRTRG
jgi:hypothetical protein